MEHVWPPNSPVPTSANSETKNVDTGMSMAATASPPSPASPSSSSSPVIQCALPASIAAPPSAPLPQTTAMVPSNGAMKAKSMPSSPSSMAIEIEPFSFMLASEPDSKKLDSL